MKKLRLLCGAAAAMFALVSTAPAQEVHQDAKLGFKIRSPKDFSKVPLKPEEEWIVARWLSDRVYTQVDKEGGGYSAEQKPEMYVIAFPHNAEKVKEEKVGTGTGGKGEITIISVKNPFKDYDDYLKRTYSEGGFYKSVDEKAEIEGVAVQCLEYKVEKLSRGGPRRIVAWIFKGDDADFAVQFEMFESTWPKLKPEILSSLRSFRRIKAGDAKDPKDAKDTQGDKSSGLPGVLRNRELEELTPAQRASRRRDLAKAEQEKAAKGLPKEWFAKKIGRVFVLSHTDEKTADRVASECSSILDWLDTNLGYIGPGEYVREPIVRICKDSDEEQFFRKGGEGSWTRGTEIVTHKDTSGSAFGGESGWVKQEIAQHWFQERDNELYREMPAWLEWGITALFEHCAPKGKSLEFYPDSYSRVRVAQMVKAGTFVPLQDLMKKDGEDLRGGASRGPDEKGSPYDECTHVVRFLLTNSKKSKDAFKAYLDALTPVIHEHDEKRKKEMEGKVADKAPTSEEEEDAQFKAKSKERFERDKTLLTDVFTRAFGTWSDADWKPLEREFRKNFE
jgi:hypothetical protein